MVVGRFEHEDLPLTAKTREERDRLIKKLESMDVDEKELKETCAKFRQEELEHRDSGIEHGARETLGYNGLSALVKTGSRIAIWLSERI